MPCHIWLVYVLCWPYLTNPSTLLLVLVAGDVSPLKPAKGKNTFSPLLNTFQEHYIWQECPRKFTLTKTPFGHFDVDGVARRLAVVVKKEVDQLRFQTAVFQGNSQVSGKSRMKSKVLMSTWVRASVRRSEEERRHDEPACEPSPCQSCRGAPRYTWKVPLLYCSCFWIML